MLRVRSCLSAAASESRIIKITVFVFFTCLKYRISQLFCKADLFPCNKLAKIFPVKKDLTKFFRII